MHYIHKDVAVCTPHNSYMLSTFELAVQTSLTVHDRKLFAGIK